MPRHPAPAFQDLWMETPQTSELTGISIPALEQDRCTGQLGIPYYKFGSRVRYRLSEVVAWAENHRVMPPVRQEQGA
jgi:hypothetical protein